MYLQKLSLINFRNHVNSNYEFDKKTTVIVGMNGQGKTNILEAVNLLATGESFRDGKVEEMVNLESELGHVGGKLINEELDESDKAVGTLLQVAVTRGVVQGKRVAGKRYMVNGVPRNKAKFLGHFSVVIFRPEDLRVVEGSPSRRRQLLDEILSQADPEYGRCLVTYKKGLIRRNKTLEMIREGKIRRTALEFWDRLVVKNGEYLQRGRRNMVDFFNQCKFYHEFGLQIDYDASVMSEARLEQYADREVSAGHTLVGPHRDDFSIMALHKNGYQKGVYSRNLAMYGSRGEQRLGVLWIKLMGMEFLESSLKARPVLMLDDILSELDHEHRELVESVRERQQTLVTTADEHYVQGWQANKWIRFKGED